MRSALRAARRAGNVHGLNATGKTGRLLVPASKATGDGTPWELNFALWAVSLLLLSAADSSRAPTTAAVPRADRLDSSGDVHGE